MIGMYNNNSSGAQRPAVITGMGLVSSLGQGIPILETALRNGLNRFKISSRFPELSFPVIAAELVDFSFEQAINRFTASEALLAQVHQAGRRAPLVIQASLTAALEAWFQAKLHERKINPIRIGLVVAGNNLTQRYQYDLQSKFQQNPSYLSPTYALHFMDTDQVGALSEAFGIQGEGFTVGGASASGNMAIIQGQRLIQQGLVDVCLVVGALADLSPVELQGFYNIGALGGRSFCQEPAKASRPFDQAHEGFIWGQASACLILESTASAAQEKIPILAEIAGMAITLDGNRSAHPNPIGEARAMQQALTNAALSPQVIDYINAHGTSSPVGDTTEITAIRDVFGTSVADIWLNSTKSLLGHCLWSAGVVEAIATILQMQGNFVHPNPNLDHPIDQECHFVGKQSKAAEIHVAMSNSFGFGGINTSIILTRGK